MIKKNKFLTIIPILLFAASCATSISMMPYSEFIIKVLSICLQWLQNISHFAASATFMHVECGQNH